MKLGTIIKAVNVINNHIQDPVENMGISLHILKFINSVSTETKFWDEKFRAIVEKYTVEVEGEDGKTTRQIDTSKINEFNQEVEDLAAIEEEIDITLTEADVSGFKNVTLEETAAILPILKA